MKARLCGRCGHLAGEHRRPGWLWALFGRWACAHPYELRGHLGITGVVRCQCDGWKATR